MEQTRQYYGMGELDKKIEQYVNYDNGYFVELGANDGELFSNTLYFERHRNWHGVLIDPVLHNYILCCTRRSSKNKFFCNACVSFDYKEKYVDMIYSNLLTISLGLESDIPNPFAHAEHGKKLMQKNEDNVRFGALASPLNDLLEKAQSPQLMDLLVLDVEGSEMEVLKGVNHDQFRFKFICIECRDKAKMVSYLSQHGYVLVDQLEDCDYMFADVR